MNIVPIRRLMDADHSCLFKSIIYLLDRDNFNEDCGMMARQLIVEYIVNTPNTDTFNESLLGTSRQEYIDYIADPMNWGGALELKMFSDIFKSQIVCIDTTNKRYDVYGDNMYHTKRVYILYDDEHYDPLVMNFDEECDPLTDMTIFSPYDMITMEQFKGYFL